jgi:TonB family protein
MIYSSMVRRLLALLLLAGPALAQTTQEDAPVTEGVPKFVPPKILQKAPAPYPEEAAKAELSGTVVLEIDVDERGRVGNVVVKERAGHGFDEAAVEAVKKFVFSPASNDGSPVPSRVTYSYKFVIKTVPKPAPAKDDRLRDMVRIKGTISIRGQRRPLGGAEVAAIATDGRRFETASDDDGRFALRGLPAGAYKIIVVGRGARRFTADEKLGERDVVTVAYYVEPSEWSRYESTVRGDLNREEISRKTLSTEELMKLPGSFGDALRAIENLPGVARAPFNTGLIIVRGGKPTDSKTFLGADEVPQLYHFGGLTSIVPTRLIDHVDYFPGNFGVRYGRAIAGAIDVELREGRRDHWHGSVELNAFDIGATAEGPTPNKKGSFILAARRSYVDAVLAAALPSGSGVQFQSAPVYYDYQAIFDYQVDAGHIKLMFLGSDDQLKLVFDTPQADPLLTSFGTHIFFHKTQLRYTRAIAGWQLFAQIAGGYSGQDGSVGRDLHYGVGIGSVNGRFELRRPLRQNLKLLVGVDGGYNHVDLDLNVPAPTREGQIPSPISASQRQNQHEPQEIGLIALFAELSWKPLEKLSLTGGIRYDWYSPLHVGSFDPRLSLRAQLAKYTTLKIGVGQYSQMPQAIDFNRVFGNPNERPERALHTALTLEQGIAPGLQGELTGFYKQLYDLSAPTTNLTMRDGKLSPENVASIGEGRVYGLEVLLRQSVSKYMFGWISYTLMRSERKDCPTCSWRIFDFDQTHILIVALHAYLPRGWELGLRFRYISGFPATPPYGGYYNADSDVYSPAQGPVNTTRLEAFHALDFRVDKTFLFKQWSLKLYLDIYNVYNHQSQEVIQPSYDFSRTQPINGLPIIPSFGIRAEI